MQIANLTTCDIDDYLKKSKTIILPFGSLEQHGPHLPCGTDTFIAERIALEASKEHQFMVAPVLPFGFSPGLHPQMTGTVTISAITYITLVKEILDNLTRSGFSKFVCITGHGMNFSPLKTAVMDFLNENNGKALVLGYWEIDEVMAEKQKLNDDNGVHCTVMETSMMMYLLPDMVDMGKSIDEYNKTSYLLGKKEIRKISKSGIIANTRNSTVHKGELYFNAAVRGLSRIAKTLDAH